MTRFASAAGVRLAYDVAGAGDPPMVFVHGWCCDRSYFAPQVTHFSFIQLEVPEQVNAMIERFLAITGLPAHE